MNKTDYFPLLSGHLSLDLVNTEVIRWGTRHDLLVSKDELLLWIHTMEENGCLYSHQITKDIDIHAEAILQTAYELRSFLRKGFEAIIDEKAIDSHWVRQLEYLMGQAPLSYKLIENHLLPIPIGNPEKAFSSLLAFDALQLLVEEKYKAFRRCSNPECVLLFLDVSGRRKWCSMKICGNRAKVARHNKERKK